jgi:competence ComEA-like helix-hairpin-helix protein
MESQAQVVANAAENVPKVDLNHANQETLETLAGIGPALAHRIIAHREQNGPFLFASDVVGVPGIGQVLYDRLADQVTATIPSAGELAAAPEDIPPEEAETGNGSEPTAGALVAPDVALPLASAEEPASPTQEQEAPSLEAPPEEDAEEAGEDVGPEVGKEPATADQLPTREAASRSRWGWLWPTLLGSSLGALMGMVLALLVFAGINGAIDISRTQAFDGLRAQLAGLSTEVDAIRGDVSGLQGDVAGLRERVEVLAGLTARVEQAEARLSDFSEEIAGLQEDSANLQSSVADLTTHVDELEITLDAVEEQTRQATTFFERLQTLLEEIFGSPTPEGREPAPSGGSI